MPRGHDYQPRAHRRAAFGAEHAVAAALRRLRRRFRFGLDADPRRAPAARGRSRLRAVRPRRLAGPARAPIAATGAQRVYVTHGYSDPLVRWLRERGLDAQTLATRFTGEQGSAEHRSGGKRRGGAGAVKRFAQLYTRARQHQLDARASSPRSSAISATPRRKTRRGRCTSSPATSRGRWCLRAGSTSLPARSAASPPWLMDECYEAVGDLAETVAHVLPPAQSPSDEPLQRLGRGAPAAARRRERRRARRRPARARGASSTAPRGSSGTSSSPANSGSASRRAAWCARSRR